MKFLCFKFLCDWIGHENFLRPFNYLLPVLKMFCVFNFILLGECKNSLTTKCSQIIDTIKIYPYIFFRITLNLFVSEIQIL